MSNIVVENLVDSIESTLGQVKNVINELQKTYSSELSLMGEKGVQVGEINNFLIVGCGGTGSWFAPKFIKILNDAVSKGMLENARVLFVDGDIVEDKNLIRQNFVYQDIGKNKAEVLAERYGMHASDKLQIGYLDKYLVTEYYNVPEEFRDKFAEIDSLELVQQECLVINLIDNGKTRKMLHEWAGRKANLATASRFRHRRPIIDVANNEFNGQLTFSYYDLVNPSTYGSYFYNELPHQLAEEDDISAFSCADADSESTDQLFNANDMAASVLGNFVNSLIVDRKVMYGRVDFVTGGTPSIAPSIPLYEWPKAFGDFVATAEPDKITKRADKILERPSDEEDASSRALAITAKRLLASDNKEDFNLFKDSVTVFQKEFLKGIPNSEYAKILSHAMTF